MRKEWKQLIRIYFDNFQEIVQQLGISLSVSFDVISYFYWFWIILSINNMAEFELFTVMHYRILKQNSKGCRGWAFSLEYLWP